MTKLAKVTLCATCRYDGGWHDDGNGGTPYRCPNFTAGKNHNAALKLTAAANEKAFTAAQLIIREVADHLDEFSGNDTRQRMEHASVPGQVVGAAFKACETAGVIEATGRFVQSTDPGTRHKIAVWRSVNRRAR